MRIENEKTKENPYLINVAPEEREWLVNLFLDEVKRQYGENLLSVVLYGSTARGTARPDSDIDLLVVSKNIPESKLERIEQLFALEQKISKDFEATFNKFAPYVSLIIKSENEAPYHSPLYLDMLEDGKILFDRDGFIAAVFDNMRRRLRALGARRVWMGDQWYWDLKPDYRYGEVFEI